MLSAETGALGSAILGFAAVQGRSDMLTLAKGFVRHGQPVLPNPEYAAFYAQQLQRFRNLRTLLLEELNHKEKTYA